MSRNLTAKLVIAPTVLAVAIGFYGTIAWTAYVSLTRSGIVPNYELAGFFQYARLFQTARWYTAMSNMVVFGLLFVLIALSLGTLLAILIDQKVRFEGVFRTIYLYPLSMSFIVTGLAWQWFLNPTSGLQSFVRHLGWENFTFDWIVDRDRAIYTIVVAAVWQFSGLVMAIMLAGLRGIDGDIWRAARCEGIPRWRAYVSIVLPMLKPMLVTCLVLLTVQVVKGYDLVVAMTKGGPGNATDVPGKFVVDMAFARANIGLASAAAMVMLAAVLAALVPFFYIQASGKER